MEDIISNPTEPVNVVPEFIDSEVKKLDKLAKDTLDIIIVRAPVVASVVEVVDVALADSSCSFGLFGWILSAKRSRRSPATSEAPLNKVSN